jgi:hypothetical protein
MSRYIDADKLVDLCDELAREPWNQKAAPISWADAFEDFISEIEGQPTADVVPKSEVAREIFEDLEMYVEEHNGCSVNLSRCEFAELKKKYTKGD